MDQLNILRQQGFSRLLYKNQIVRIDEVIENKDSAYNLPDLFILIDRLLIKADDFDLNSRIADSVQTAFYEGMGNCHVHYETDTKVKISKFSNKFELDGIQFEEPTINFFTFNNPFGICKSCEGLEISSELTPNWLSPINPPYMTVQLPSMAARRRVAKVLTQPGNHGVHHARDLLPGSWRHSRGKWGSAGSCPWLAQ